MNDRQRFIATMHYQPRDRAPLYDFTFLHSTLPEWHRQGLPDSVDLSNIADFLGMDTSFGIGPDKPIDIGVNVGLEPAVPLNQLPLLMHHSDWETYYMPRLDPDNPARLPADWEARVVDWKDPQRGYILTLPGGSLYGWLRDWMGIENLSFIIHDEPVWFEEIIERITDCIIGTLTRVLNSGVQFDACGLWEDMCYNSGPMISPAHFQRYMLKHYERITTLLRRYGVDITWIDSDGKVDSLIPLWLESGINCIFPVEIGTWGDPLRYRQTFGRDLRMMGGFDQNILAASKVDIEREVYRLAPLVEEGGYIPFCDHHIAPDVSLDNYLFYLETARQVWGRDLNLKPLGRIQSAYVAQPA